MNNNDRNDSFGIRPTLLLTIILTFSTTWLRTTLNWVYHVDCRLALRQTHVYHKKEKWLTAVNLEKQRILKIYRILNWIDWYVNSFCEYQAEYEMKQFHLKMLNVQNLKKSFIQKNTSPNLRQFRFFCYKQYMISLLTWRIFEYCIRSYDKMQS